MAGQNLEHPGDASELSAHCLTIQDGRQRCAAGASADLQGRSEAAGAWRLVRTPNPAGGRDAVSIMQTADISGSDLGFAGVMLRCNNGAIEVLIALVRPLPPRSKIRVTIQAGTTTNQFIATTVAPGVLLLLPPAAAALASGPWQTAPKLAIVIDDDNGPIHGAIAVAGLPGALQELLANCSTP